MVVEDDNDIRESICELLADDGYTAVGAENGRDALDKLGQMEPPALVLLDLRMPIMDGLGFRAAQLLDPRLVRIPVVLVTAERNAARVASDLGVSGFLTKPAEPDHLLAVVAQFCRKPRDEEDIPPKDRR